LFNAADAALLVLDAGIITLSNPAAEKLLGYPAGVRGQSPSCLLAPDRLDLAGRQLFRLGRSVAGAV
jgi:PAS domain S-box-containing protein